MREPETENVERALIGCVLVHPTECRPVVADLDPSDFWTAPGRRTWEAMRTLAASDSPLDITVVGDALERGGGFDLVDGPYVWLSECTRAAPVAEHAEFYADKIRAAATKRRLVLLCAQVSSLATSGEDLDQCLGRLREGLGDLEVLGRSGGPVRIGDAIDGVIDAIISRAERPQDHAVMTGLDAFDRKVGGMRPGNLVIVAGPPGMGKTAWAISTAFHNAIVGEVPTLVVSLEMDVGEVVERFLAQKSGVSGHEMATGAVARSYELQRRVDKAAIAMRPKRLWIEDRHLPIGRILGECRKWHMQHVTGAGANIGLIVIDYLGLVVPDVEERSISRANEVAKMTRSFKNLAKSLRCPVVLLSQLNRQYAQCDRPELVHLRDSGAIEQDANLVIFPWRDIPVDGDGGNPNEPGPAEWIIAKNRNGPTGTVNCYWQAGLMKFVDEDENNR